MKNELLSGRIALITGAARGIGKACAEKMAEYGADVVLVDINQEMVTASAAEIAGQYGKKAYAYTVDLSDLNTCVHLFDTISKEVGAIDILANCAGITVSKCLIDVTEDDWERVMGVNLKAIWYLSKLFAGTLTGSVPMHRMAEPEEIGELAAFLCQRQSRLYHRCHHYYCRRQDPNLEEDLK